MSWRLENCCQWRLKWMIVRRLTVVFMGVGIWLKCNKVDPCCGVLGVLGEVSPTFMYESLSIWLCGCKYILCIIASRRWYPFGLLGGSSYIRHLSGSSGFTLSTEFGSNTTMMWACLVQALSWPFLRRGMFPDITSLLERIKLKKFN